MRRLHTATALSNCFAAAILFVASPAQAQVSPAAMAQVAQYQAEGLPSELVARLEVRDRFLKELTASPQGFTPQYIIETLKRWDAGGFRVAFNGGSNELRKAVTDAAVVWLSHGNTKLDFGPGAAIGVYRNWSETDTSYAAEVRISFNQKGYWSLVGRDSVEPMIVNPGQASMNFGGFAIGLPANYRTVVAHEFGHAFGFQHEHQSPLGGCDSQFRWYDDPQYIATTDQYGQYITDPNQRRPGLYTVLGGPLNNWPATEVDRNLKQLPNSSAFQLGTFDPKSIMMYSFPGWMFISENSPCHTAENTTLSDGDIAGFGFAYPSTPATLTTRLNQRREFLQQVLKLDTLPATGKSQFKAMFDAIH